MPSIHAELAGDGTTIVLLAGGLGDPEDVALAAKRLKALTPLFSKSDPPGALTVTATWGAVVQLSETFGTDWRPGPRLQGWIAEQAVARTSVQDLAYIPPAGLTPYPWQVAGAQMIAATGRALITDEPGTGKTITTILGLVERTFRGEHAWSGKVGSLCTCGWSAVGDRNGIHEDWRRHVKSDASVGPAIVLCPASVVDPWVEAWRAWAPHVRAVAWRGTPKQRQALAGTADIYVTSYETARMDASVMKGHRPLVDLKAGALVIDECHLIKNHQAARSQAARRLAKGVAQRHGAVVALSGTPITHHPGDLWPTLEALEPDAWPSRQRWVQRYCQTLPGDYSEEILGLLGSREPEFRLTLLGQHRRIAKADVLTQLPPKVYSVRTVDLPATWRKAYDDMEAQMLAELPDGAELSVMSVLAQLTRLAQLSSAAADVATEVLEEIDAFGQPKIRTRVTLKAPSWKVDALLEVLDERCGPNGGHQVVAFAPSRQLMQLAGQAAAQAGYRVGYVVGGQAQSERTSVVEAFQAGDLDLICATTGAGGVGLTLTAARTVVFLQRPWSIVEATQAEDRCHRIGSERHDSIEVIDIVARKTIDARVRAVLRERASQLADLVQDPRIVTELLGGLNAQPSHGTTAGEAPAAPLTYEREAS